MAAFPGFTVQLATPRYVPRDRVRLAVAITFSVLIHLGLAGGVTVSTTGHAPSGGQSTITARLDIPEHSLAEPPPQQDDAMVIVRRVTDSLTRTRPADDNERETAATLPLPAAAPVQVMTAARNPASALPPLSDPEYYPARQLDVYPVLVQPVNLEYPRHGAYDYAGGRVLLMVLIDETGGVRELSIVEAGSARFFENSVRTAFSDARFSPARKDGRAVKSRVLISVDYRPDDTEGRP